MSDADKRDYVLHMYHSDRWRRRVKAMSDSQVFAIWKRDQAKQEQIKKDKRKKESGSDDIPF